jgi:hypothetical protein
MKKNIIQFLPLFTVIALTIGLSSCKKDEEPPPVKPKLSFAAPTMMVNEADGTIEVEVALDKPAAEDITIEYSLNGTAKNKASVAANQAYDYEILTDAGEIEIVKGETTGTIEILLTSDYFIEIDIPETIEIAIEDVDSDDIEITRDDEIEITIEQEDGLVIFLYWPEPTADSVADMDILVRKGATASSWDAIVTGSVQETNTPPEVVFIPKSVNDAAFGLSYVYYDGTMNELKFTVIFADLIGGELEDESGVQTFEGTYKLSNRNKWTDANTSLVVQTFIKSGGNATEISQITVPTSGSRAASPGHIDSTLKKGNTTKVSAETIRSLLKKWNKN